VAGLLTGDAHTAWFQTLAGRPPHGISAFFTRFPRIGQWHPRCPSNGRRSSDPERTQSQRLSTSIEVDRTVVWAKFRAMAEGAALASK
jgi:hypothetical protein